MTALHRKSECELPQPGRRFKVMVEALKRVEWSRRLGTVKGLQGLAIEAVGPRTHVGELCAILPPGHADPGRISDLLRESLPVAAGDPGGAARSSGVVLAEVVGVHPDRVTLMPFGGMQGLVAGSQIVALGDHSRIGVGEALLGRIIDGFGRPLDGLVQPMCAVSRPLRGAPTNPLKRPRIRTILETGIRSIDALLTLGQGQRVGIFSGSGVGKSTLLGMIARHAKADVNVIALIGERGREVREFIEKQLGPDGLRRSVVVVATADQPALARIRAAHAALSIAEHFREEGKQVLLTMDSITRLAMARREVGLSAGEPPTARGYTPSVFAELPELCERCGTSASGGAITALLTVLVEGDDFNEPVSDALRAILDGHIVLSRHLAHQGQYPAIDHLKSVSRLLQDLTTGEEQEAVRETTRVLAMLDRNHQMIELGAYEKGSNPELDAILACQSDLLAWLRQSQGGIPRATALQQLSAWLAALQTARTGPLPVSSPGSSPVKSASQAPARPGPDSGAHKALSIQPVPTAQGGGRPVPAARSARGRA